MKKRLTIVVFALLMSIALVMGAFTAFADLPEAANGYEFNQQLDTVFEDFDRDVITDTTTLNESANDSGVSYVRVKISDTNTTPGGAIYKQAANNADSFSKAGYLVFVMRSTDGVKLADLVYGARGPAAVDKDANVYKTDFASLEPGTGDFAELGTTWQKYVIDIEESFSGEYYPDSIVDSSNPNDHGVEVILDTMQGLHLMVKNGAATDKHLDISAVYLTTDAADNTAGARIYFNKFQGSDRVAATAKNALAGTYWADAGNGEIVKRSVTLNDGGIATVVNDEKKATGYAWAVIEAEGDTAGLTVATSENGTAFGTAVPFADGIAVTDNVYGFRFSYNGDGSAKINRIYYTNFVVREAVTEYPCLDGGSALVLDDFAIDQEHILNYEQSSSNQPTADDPASIIAGRYGYNVDGLIYVKNDMLVMDATKGLIAIDFDIKGAAQPNVSDYQYIVFKVRATNDATVESMRFRFNNAGEHAWFNGGVKSAYGLNAATLGQDGYPYVNGGWTYLIADINETFTDGITGAKIANLNIYYGGNGILLIDEIFFANGMTGKVSATDTTILSDVPATFENNTDGYQYGMYTYVGNNPNNYPYLVIEMKGETAATTLSSVRLGFEDKSTPAVDLGVRWFVSNPGGTLISNYGRAMNALTTQTQAFVIDLAASNLNAPLEHMHWHSEGTNGKITVERVYYAASVPTPLYEKDSVAFDDFEREELFEEGWYWWDKDNSTNVSIVDGALVMDMAANSFAVLKAGRYPNNSDKEYQFIHLRMKTTGGIDFASFRFEDPVNGADTAYWNAGKLLGPDGNPIEKPGNEWTDVYIDIDAMGFSRKIEGLLFRIGDWANSTAGQIIIDEICFVNLAADYSVMLAELPGYAAAPVTTAPALTINNTQTLVKAGEVTIDYTAQAELLRSVTVSYKENADAAAEIVTVSANKFTVNKNGIYTISMTVIDAHGNSTTKTHTINADITAPVVAFADDMVTEAVKGDEVQIKYTATDNVSSGSDLVAAVSVKLGETDVTVTDGKFTANSTGEYVITVTATDKAGNSTAKSHTVTVTEAEKTGCETGCGVIAPADGTINGGLIAVLSVAALVALGLAVGLKKKSGSLN